MAPFTPKPGFNFTPTPPREALGYFRRKGFKVGFDFRDVWREEHATAFTVAKAMSLDVLQAIRGEVGRALEEGRTLRQFQKDLTPTLQKLGWWGVKPLQDPKTGKTVPARLGSPRRLRTIYRANLRTARAAGQWQRAERTKASHPYLIYRLGPSEVHRPLHVQWDGTVLSLDDPWWKTHLPPNGWGCKCHVRQVSRAEAKRRDWKIGPAPKGKKRKWLNKRTGKTQLVPEGIDPGWDTNPGLIRKGNQDRLMAGKLEAADPLVAQVAIRDVMAQGFQNFMDSPKGFFPVLRLADEAAQAIGAERKVAVLSADTLEKNRRRHQELGLEDYLALPELGESPQVIVLDRDNSVVIVRRSGRLYRAAVKVAQTGGRETFVTTFHRTYPKQVTRIVNRGKIVFGKWEE